jgi:hypothetical protein
MLHWPGLGASVSLLTATAAEAKEYARLTGVTIARRRNEGVEDAVRVEIEFLRFSTHVFAEMEVALKPQELGCLGR